VYLMYAVVLQKKTEEQKRKHPNQIKNILVKSILKNIEKQNENLKNKQNAETLRQQQTIRKSLQNTVF